MTETFPELLACAHAMADQAGKVIMPYFRSRLSVANKDGGGGFDPVTLADQAAERAILAVMRERFPSHAFEGEEFGQQQAASAYRWVIDPIDGTRAFILGQPNWGTLIGLRHESEPVLGVLDQPFTQERFFADATSSHWRGATGEVITLQTRACAELKSAMFSTTHPDLFGSARDARILEQLKAQTRMTRYGGDCYGYGLLAAGHIDLIVETGLKSHDVMALIPIIERAGGRITTWEGASAIHGGNVIAAGDPKLHGVAMALVAGIA